MTVATKSSHQGAAPSPLLAGRPPRFSAGETWGVTGLTLITGTDAPDTQEGLLGGAILIKDGVIVDVGPAAEVHGRWPTTAFANGNGFTVFPGLVNAHSHAAMGFFRGLGHGHDQMIESFLFPAERSLTAELLEPLSYSYLLAGLRSGTTCFGDHYYFAEGIARGLETLGLRGIVGETCADLGGAFPGKAAFKTWQNLIDQWPFSSRITPAIAPHAADTVSAPFLAEMGAFAKLRGLPLHMHLSQTDGERDRVLKREQCSPVAYAAKAGVLSDKTLAVHLVSASQEDLHILRDHGVTAGYCPASQIIYERLAPVAGLHAYGIPVALGTDCAASNDGADILSEMKLAALLAKDRGVDLSDRSPAALLKQGCHHAAHVFGLGTKIGKLQPGFAADLVFARQTLSGEPLIRPLTNLIFSTGSRDIEHVMIDGRFVLWQGEPTLCSASDLSERYLSAVAVIRKRLGS